MSGNLEFTDEEDRWNAVVNRDQSADNVFYYAVKTTGVFCRPGCASRRPNRENIEFFDTREEALSAGYRPCKRCGIDAVSAQERLSKAVVRACRRLEQSGVPAPKLDELAAEAGLSPWYFHRVFKKLVGVTPKQYSATHQAQHFRQNLKTSQSVTEAIYESGFGSSSRAYEKIDDRLGTTPSNYRSGAEGLSISYGIASCYLGWVIVATTERGICAINFGDDPLILPEQVQKSFPKADMEKAGPDFDAIIQTVITYIEAPEKGLELPLDIRGTAFQERVWNALRGILSGTTVSYTELAERIGRPKAVRAVAQACAANKLAVAVPCHRVVRSDGTLSGYRWGVERKRLLLRRETSKPEKHRAQHKKNDKE